MQKKTDLNQAKENEIDKMYLNYLIQFNIQNLVEL